MSPEPGPRYFAILKEELLKIPGKVSPRMAAETNPAMVGRSGVKPSRRPIGGRTSSIAGHGRRHYERPS
jgi:hypothetical protein